MTIGLFRARLLFDYWSPLAFLTHVSTDYAVSPLVVRLAGIEPTFGLNPSRPTPLLDFAKASRLRKTKKWMTQVDDIQCQV